MNDRPGSETIHPPSILISTKPTLTRRARFRPERVPHVLTVTLNLVQRIDVRISELPKSQASGAQLGHDYPNLAQDLNAGSRRGVRQAGRRTFECPL
jgi:hypothetical protein